MARPKKTTAAKAVEVKAEETVKAVEVKAEEAVKPAAEEKKPAEKKAPAKKPAAAKKPAEKKTPAKKAVKETAAESKVVVQYAGAEVNADELVEKAKTASGVSDIKKVDVYVRPEVNKVYYVVNGNCFGDFDLF